MMAKKDRRRSFCIMCGKERDGIEIKDDYVIKTIRYVKKTVFKSVKNNMIVVCGECYGSYKKYRKRYMRRQAMYVALGILFMIVLTITSGSLAAVFAGLGITLLLYLLSLLNYVPELGIKAPKKGK